MTAPLLGTGAEVQRRLTAAGAPSALIGAYAMALHGASRATSDLDLGLAVPLDELRRLVQVVSLPGATTELREPDPDDPLGGVVDIETPAGLVQLVNFVNSVSADQELGRRLGDALVRTSVLHPSADLRVADLPHLIASKLYTWDRRQPRGKGYVDAVALLDANPKLDLDVLRNACVAVGLRPEVEAFLSFARPEVAISTVGQLVLARDARSTITAHVERDYPREACGVLLGRVEGDRRVVERAHPAANLNTERAHDRYEMDPKDRLAAEASARAAGLAVVGFYHSHPDHDAYFSATDLARCEEVQWGEPWVPPTYAYVVVSVRAGRVATRKAFLIVDGSAREMAIA